MPRTPLRPLTRSIVALLAGAALAPLAASQSPAPQPADGCVLVLAKNLAKGNGNFFVYMRFADAEIEVRKGDRLEYDLFLAAGNPSAKGGVDVEFSDGEPLRDSGAKDAAGERAHGDAVLSNAVGKWLTRSIALDAFAGKKTKKWWVQFEGDEPGDYTQCIDRVAVVRADGERVSVAFPASGGAKKIDMRHGYSERVLVTRVARDKVVAGAGFDAIVTERRAKEHLYYDREELLSELEVAKRFAKAEKRDDVVEELKQAGDVPSPEEYQGTAEAYHDLLHARRRSLDHAHPLMRAYAGHLVGHAHIDLQWLWEWPEGLDFSRGTFEQVLKFMDEYPDFTFSQSSAGLYAAIEEQYPDLFARMAARVKEGRFETVGGRWCEGDTNMISSESQARHFLLAQRYFKRAFGAAATVGWEPDTFGHSAAMPQLLKLAGIDSYYFCRGGKNLPLFWWEGLDGTKVLAFDEPASGSWYNSDITPSNVDELLTFYEKTGLKDLIWVYGVGNHGGGPTREQIEKALSWRTQEGRPTVKFGTARKFFDLCKAKNLDSLPTVQGEMNPVFDGCYSTHSDMKHLNRESEAALATAETIAWMASAAGFPYPRADFERAWQDVLWNHHHDTLPGSGIHESYELSHVQLNGVIDRARWITRAATRHLANRVADEGDGKGILVLNPLGWTRSGVVECESPGPIDPMHFRVLTASGERVPAEVVDGEDGAKRVRFIAKDAPSFGYTVYRVAKGPAITSAGSAGSAVAEESEKSIILKNASLTCTIDRATGELTSVTQVGREVLVGGRRGNRLEAHMEEPHGMSAWVIGKIAEVQPVTAVKSIRVISKGPVEARVEVVKEYHQSTIRQEISIAADSERIDFATDLDWRERGGEKAPAPMLRVAFPLGDAAEGDAKASFEYRSEIAFGDLVRPVEGKEMPSLGWTWIMNPVKGGAALMNDSKHGYCAKKDGELTLTLVRSSYAPDPVPDVGRQRFTYSLLPLAAGAIPALVTKAAAGLQQPLVAEPLRHNTVNGFTGDRVGGALPARHSFVSFENGATVVATALKRAESGRGADDTILRLYDGDAKPADFRVHTHFPWVKGAPVNLIEEPLAGAAPLPVENAPGAAQFGNEASFPMKLGRYEIVTLRLQR